MCKNVNNDFIHNSWKLGIIWMSIREENNNFIKYYLSKTSELLVLNNISDVIADERSIPQNKIYHVTSFIGNSRTRKMSLWWNTRTAVASSWEMRREGLLGRNTRTFLEDENVLCLRGVMGFKDVFICKLPWIVLFTSKCVNCM